MFDVDIGLVAFGLRKNMHTPFNGSLDPSVASTRLILCLLGVGAIPVCNMSPVT